MRSYHCGPGQSCWKAQPWPSNACFSSSRWRRRCRRSARRICARRISTRFIASTPIRRQRNRPGGAASAACPIARRHCPLHNNIPDWLRLTAEGRLQEAYEISQATNTFPEICGRICPQDRLCEGNCVIETVGPWHGHHRVGREIHHRHGLGRGLGQTDPPDVERTELVGIIGAGPGGLAAADMLRPQGRAGDGL